MLEGDIWELMNYVADCRTPAESGSTPVLAAADTFDNRLTACEPVQNRPLVLGLGEGSVTLMLGAEGWKRSPRHEERCDLESRANRALKMVCRTRYGIPD